MYICKKVTEINKMNVKDSCYNISIAGASVFIVNICIHLYLSFKC